MFYYDLLKLRTLCGSICVVVVSVELRTNLTKFGGVNHESFSTQYG